MDAPLETTAPSHGRPPGIQHGHDPAQESLVRALRSSFNVLRIIMLGLVVLYVFSGLFRIQPGEQGLVARLGRLRTAADGSYVFSEGTHLAWPDPFDQKIILTGQAQRLNVNSFIFTPRDRTRPLEDWEPQSNQLKPGVDGAMITGDRNLSHAVWEVEYRVGRADRFVTNVGDRTADAELLLLRLAENAVVRSVASRRVEEVLRGRITEIAEEVKARLQSELDRLETGLEVTAVKATTLEPRAVREAFDQVTQAASEKQKREAEAAKRETEILNQTAGASHPALIALINQYGAAQSTGADAQRLDELLAAIDAELDLAGGEVARTLNQARSRRSEIGERLRRELEFFTTQHELYRHDPLATMLRLWTDMRDAIHAGKQNEIFFLPDTRSIEIIINRDVRRAMEADVERFRSSVESRRERP